LQARVGGCLRSAARHSSVACSWASPVAAFSPRKELPGEPPPVGHRAGAHLPLAAVVARSMGSSTLRGRKTRRTRRSAATRTSVERSGSRSSPRCSARHFPRAQLPSPRQSRTWIKMAASTSRSTKAMGSCRSEARPPPTDACHMASRPWLKRSNERRLAGCRHGIDGIRGLRAVCAPQRPRGRRGAHGSATPDQRASWQSTGPSDGRRLHRDGTSRPRRAGTAGSTPVAPEQPSSSAMEVLRADTHLDRLSRPAL